MSEPIKELTLVMGIPFFTVALCWIALMITMRKTTGELKHWLTPDNVIKGVAVVFIVNAVMALAVLGKLNSEVIGTILSGIIGYTLGTRFHTSADNKALTPSDKV